MTQTERVIGIQDPVNGAENGKTWWLHKDIPFHKQLYEATVINSLYLTTVSRRPMLLSATFNFPWVLYVKQNSNCSF
jgi:hypothetical protein